MVAVKGKKTAKASTKKDAGSNKMVYFFGGGSADGKATLKNLLGGKGANLAEMTRLKVPVPPGFTISTEVCTSFYKNNKKFPELFWTSKCLFPH